ncbi:hypothetical protein Godav_001515 [Gossypium davidsonii]|uniref:CCHC-type domain-containing protein n=1 Tax=Gossypium davidsonii TaxID=34287 RepID=A0A7J8T455_GOSDV|nr:hypothetical protein [Gossypium davidsonii]
MEENGGENREGRDEISLLADELIQLTVKGSKVVPNSKPTLICTVWTRKLYNQESFRAQMRSIWKTKKKFEIQRVGQNLSLIVFELEEDLESILEGRPWLFRKNLILFNRLSQEIERDQISLTSSPFWIKIDSHLPEFDKKDLMHAIGVTFGGVIRSEISDTCCRLRIRLDVWKPLRRGIFVSSINVKKMWVPFKYENLPIFCFGCGRMGHGLTDCTQIIPARKSKISSDPPYSMALKAESKQVGKESLQFSTMWRLAGVQSSYTGGQEVLIGGSKEFDKNKQELKEIQENMEIMGGKDLLKLQENKFGTEEVVEIDNSKAQEGTDINHEKRRSWKSIKTMDMEVEVADDNRLRKRKFTEEGSPRSSVRVGIKKVKVSEVEDFESVCSERMMVSAKQTEVQNLSRSAAANRQADRAL